jgi:mannosyltransferase OCH1-like enzyme
MVNITKYEMTRSIPRLIHQTCTCKKQLPEAIQENIRKMCDLNPDWEHRLYDDADIEAYILTHYDSEILRVYRRINSSYGAARADLFRYLLMYAEGGVYLDIKSTVTQPLDGVITLDDCYILSKWDNHETGAHYNWGMHPELTAYERGEYQQWHIITVAGHPFLRAVIESVIKNIQQYNIVNDGVGRMAVLKCTGPITYTLAIEKLKSLHPYREVDIARDLGIIYSIYESSAQTERPRSHLSGKHYSRMRSPLIKPRTCKEYRSILMFYMKWGANILARTVLPLKA